MKYTITSILFFVLFISSCTVEPKPIVYGDDHCHFCDMTVVDKTHASQYTTKKGKSYSFDAIECLINDLSENKNETDMAFILVADYSSPKNLVDAKTATFLISENIKSPMGENLSAFSSKEIASDYKKEYGGELFSWAELKIKLSN